MRAYRADPRWQRAHATHLREDFPNADVELCAPLAACMAMYLVQVEYHHGPGDAAERLLDWAAEIEATASPAPEELAA